MRHILIAAAALVASGFVVTAASAQSAYDAGGPKQVGSMCRVNTSYDLDIYGYYAPCAYQASAQAPLRRRHRH